jgi:hypothetical protein
MKKLLPLILLAFLSAPVFAQQGSVAIKATNSATSETREVTLKGELLLKKWSKTTESYCAQGSDYYALAGEGGEHVLKLKKYQNKVLRRKVGKTVELTGKFVTRTIKADPNSQHPVVPNPITGEDDGDFECTVFEVSKISR